MRVLIKAGCDVNMPDVYDMSPLHVSAHFGPSATHETSQILIAGMYYNSLKIV